MITLANLRRPDHARVVDDLKAAADQLAAFILAATAALEAMTEQLTSDINAADRFRISQQAKALRMAVNRARGALPRVTARKPKPGGSFP